MCLICVEYQQEKLSLLEAYKNLGEMQTTLEEDHFNEVYEMLNEDFYTNILADDEKNNDITVISELYEAYIIASSSIDNEFDGTYFFLDNHGNISL